jgi:dimethylamine/trimethylamine dehydrogenase
MSTGYAPNPGREAAADPRQLGRITDWRAVQLGKLPGVEVITGRRLAAADVLDYGADIVVIATGSSWRGDGVQPGRVDRISGADARLAHVLTPEQVAAGKRPAGRNVIVYDTDCYYVGPGVAELLAGEDLSVCVVTTFPVLSPVSDETLEGDMLRADVHRRGIGVRRGLTITGIEAGSVRGHDEHGEPWSLRCDGVVLVTQQASDDALYRELAGDDAALARAGVQAVHVIGDAVAPRLVSEAVFDGHRLAREIDRPDPSQPAPYRRELPDLAP